MVHSAVGLGEKIEFVSRQLWKQNITLITGVIQ